MARKYSYLALGDSYTIGEGVNLYESFPYHAVQLLRAAGKYFHAPEIIAKTGWTTLELSSYLEHAVLNPEYDFISLLIGVNDQYSGMPASIYGLRFEELLLKCISLSPDDPKKVFVLSIPDWSLTPFAENLDNNRITKEISHFNNINKALTRTHNAIYIDITETSPENTDNLSYLAGDGLHPSATAYRRWAKMLFDKIIKNYSI